MLHPRVTPTLAALASLTLLAACDGVTDPSSRRDPALALAAGATPVTAPPTFGYQVEQLPILPAGINDSGVVVGMRAGEAAYLFNGTVGYLQHFNGTAGTYEAHAVNRRAAIVGGILNGIGLYWRSVYSAPLQIVPTNAIDRSRYVAAYAINNSDLVVGSYDGVVDPKTGRSQDRAFRWRPDGVFEDITPKNYFGGAVAVDVNDDGTIVGYGYPATGDPPQALRWPASYPAVGVEVLDQVGSDVAAINDKGFAVGSLDGTSSMVGWSVPMQTIPLAGPLWSWADDLSNLGRLVGHSSSLNAENPNRPFTVIKSATTWLPVLPYAGKSFFFALRVNACGEIVGARQDIVTGERVGFRWTRLTCDLAGIALP